MIDAFVNSKTFDKLDQSFSNQVSNLHPQFLLGILYVAISVFIIYWVIRAYKLYKAPGSELIQQYKENLEKTSADSQQKSHILTLIDQINKEILELYNINISGNHENLAQHGRKVTDMIIEQIPLTLKSMKNINHRCAVFVKDSEVIDELRIFEGSGFSVQGKDKLRLKISSSTAGNVLSSGEYKYCKDITEEPSFKPHPKATKKYHSLLCVPIKIGNNTVAVLSIDGSEKDCFSNDDIGYFQLFSNQLAIIFHIMGITDEGGGFINEEQVQNLG